MSPDDVLNFIGFGKFQVAAFLLAGFIYLSFAVDVTLYIFITDALEAEWNLTNVQYAVLPALTSVPNIIGAFTFGFLSDTFGRVWPLALSLSICALGIAAAFAPNFPAVVAIRCFSSLGVGAIQSLTVSFLSEFLPIRNRGKVLILMAVVPAIGMCASCGLAWWLLTSYGNKGWRYYLFASAVPCLIAAVWRMAFHFQSPRYLITTGKLVKAWHVFSVMAAVNGKDLTQFVAKDDFCYHMRACCTRDFETTKSTAALLLLKNFMSIFSRQYLRRTLSLSVLMFTQTLGFIGSLLFLPKVLTQLGESIYFTMMVSFVAQILGVLFMSIIVEWPHIGRLNSLRFYSFLVIIFFLLFAFVRTPVATSVFLVFLCFGMLPVSSLLYVYISESYPTNIRTISSAFFYIVQTIANLICPFLSGYLASVHTPWLYPVVWAGVFAVQLMAGLVLNYEPYSKPLSDTVRHTRT